MGGKAVCVRRRGGLCGKSAAQGERVWQNSMGPDESVQSLYGEVSGVPSGSLDLGPNGKGRKKREPRYVKFCSANMTLSPHWGLPPGRPPRRLRLRHPAPLLFKISVRGEGARMVRRGKRQQGTAQVERMNDRWGKQGGSEAKEAELQKSYRLTLSCTSRAPQG